MYADAYLSPESIDVSEALARAVYVHFLLLHLVLPPIPKSWLRY